MSDGEQLRKPGFIPGDTTKVRWAQGGKPDRMAGEPDISKKEVGESDIRVGRPDRKALAQQIGGRFAEPLPENLRKMFLIAETDGPGGFLQRLYPAMNDGISALLY